MIIMGYTTHLMPRHRPTPQRAILSDKSAPFPDNDAVRQQLERLAKENSAFIQLATVGHTSERRAIDAATITDPRSDDEQKQHVLIVAGQHGNEETARLVALRLIDYLLTPPAAQILQRQKIVVMPNLSPDAAHRNSYTTPSGIKPNLDHAPQGPVSPEARALQRVAKQLQPELYVDMHARGHAGASHDMVLFPPTRPYTEDEMILHALAQQMARHGERSGIPHRVHPLTWPGWGGHDPDQPSSTLWMYRQFKSLVFLTENSEHDQYAHPQARQIRSGVGRLKPLLQAGNHRHMQLYYAGYPCAMTIGMFDAGLVAVGKTAQARRRSRIELWRQSDAFQSVAAQIPEKPDTKIIQVHYTGKPLRHGVGVQVRVAGKVKPRSVTLNGRSLKPAETDGFVTWQDLYTTFIVACVPELSKGEHEIVFRFH